MPDFLADVNTALDGNGRATSGHRSVEEQQVLYDRGATRAHGPNAPHVRMVDGHPGAVDVAGYNGDDTGLTAALAGIGLHVGHIRNESGQGQYQGTGAHRHVDLVSANGAAPAPAGTPAGPSGGAAPTALEQSVGAAEPGLRQAESNVQATGNQYAQLFANVGGQLHDIQAQRVADLSRTVAAKEAINADVEADTTNFQDRVRPVFARRAAIAHRQEELATMNPIKRAVLGFVNRNYNSRDLAGLDTALTNEGQVAGQEYAASTQAHAQLLDVITQRYAGQDAISTLNINNLNEDLKLGENAWNIRRQQLSDSAQALGVNMQQIQGQAAVRDQVLTRATAGDLNAWTGQARNNGGTAVVNGVPISMGEIQTRSRQLQDQSLSLESHQLAVQSGRMELQARTESQLIGHMSQTEIQEAMQNGGTFHGMKLDQGQLTQSYAAFQQRNALQTQVTANGVDAATYTQYLDGYNAQTRDTMRRIQGITGAAMPAQYEQHIKTMVAMSNDYTRRLAQAPNEQVRMQLRGEFLGKITAMQGQVGGVIDHVAQGMTRNPDAQVVLGTWMKGGQLTGEQATRGLIAMFDGGALPPGLRVGGPAGQAMQAARDAIGKFYAAHDPSHTNNPQQGRAAVMSALQGATATRESKESLQRGLRDAVNQAVTGSWSGAHLDDYIQQAPALAQQLHDPAGRINPQHLRAAFLQGDQQGYQDIGRQLGMSPTQIEAIFKNGGTGEAGYNSAAGANPGANHPSFATVQSNLNALQMSFSMRALDQLGGSHDFRPSVALANFMRSDKYQGFIATHQDHVGTVGIGDMMADAISGGAPRLSIRNVANNIYSTVAQNVASEQTDIQRRVAMYGGDPLRRAGVILAAIPGINQHDEQLLLNAIKSRTIPDILGDPANPSQENSDFNNDRIDSAILHGRFQDPHLESLRRTAAQNWETYSHASDRAVNRFADIGARVLRIATTGDNQ